MARHSSSILDGLLNVNALEQRRAQLLADIERLDALLNLLAGSNGSTRPGRGVRRGRTKGRPQGVQRGGRPPAKGTIGAKILAALGDGPKGNIDLMKTVKVSRPQLSVNLNNLKKRGFVKNPSRGTWTAA